MPDQNPVAIIGMGCLFPDSIGLKKYWQLLFHGKDAITEVPDSHWSPGDYFDSNPKRPDHVYCTRGGYLKPVEFDPMEFGIPPNSLEATDTSQLLGLLAAKMALEDCGYGNNQDFDRDRTSVILGVTGTQELVVPLSSRLGHPIWRRALEESAVPQAQTEAVIQKISDSYVPWHENSFPGLLGNVVAGRICNRLDLRGTNCVVDAACASSFSAVHLSLLELQSGRSDMVVTGGVDTLNDIFMHMCFSKTHTLSATGDARPFSKDADGTVLGEGIGILVLKRLPDAERDGNRIYAVIKGLGSSSDGKSQSIYSPRSEGQARALRAAYNNAGINPATVQMIEAHGTGTRVGDSVEFKALNQVFEEFGANGNKCALGSVKSMIGHTKASAGAAGLIKAALSLHHKVLPPTLKSETPDPNLDIENSHFYLNQATRPWFSYNGDPRRAGISAFGFGGSNFHVVLEEHRHDKNEISWTGSTEVFALSANRRDGLIQGLKQLMQAANDGLSEAELSIRAAESRRSFAAEHPHRLLMVCENTAEINTLLGRAAKALDTEFNSADLTIKNIYLNGPQHPGKLAFVFPGQGSQYLSMGRDIICTFPTAMQVMEDANKQFNDPTRLGDLIYPPDCHNPQDRSKQESELKKTEIAQPAIGAVSLAMLKVLQEFGINPAATCGHSFGELTALCAAGWISETDLLDLSITRGQLMAAAGGSQNPPQGAMLAVQAPLAEIEELIDGFKRKVVLANRNSPTQGVLSGPRAEIVEIEKICSTRNIKAFRLPVSAAFHSDQIDSAVQPFLNALGQVSIKATDINVFSNTTTQVYPADPDEARNLLAQHLIRPVNFVQEIENLYNFGVRTFVEIGPKPVLTGLISATLRDRQFQTASLDASSGKAYGVADLARVLCQLASLGYPVSLTKWEGPRSTSRKPRLNVLLKGTNHKNPRTESREQKAETGKQKLENPTQKAMDRATLTGDRLRQSSSISDTNDPKQLESKPMVSQSRRNSKNILTNPNINPMKKDKQMPSEFVSEAYQVVTEGLKSMQRLQSQTAEAHQKFLETQAEASRILQQMMKNTQHLAEGTLGIQAEPDIAEIAVESRIATPPQQPAAEPTPASKAIVNHSNSTGSPTLQQNDAVAPTPADLNLTRAAANGFTEDHKALGSSIEPDRQTPAQHADIEATILEIVSHLTGYPIEMLGMDMDIEAELGIDSIKRVEILSNLEETIPGLPTVSPEIMGNLKTLGQIVEFLQQPSAGQSDEQLVDAPIGPAEITPTTNSVNSGNSRAHIIEATLLEVVSQLTGYPIEMLGMDMDIEAELGIDSIKRVEILSTLEEKMPDLPAVSPDMMGTLKTLGQISEFICNGRPEDTVDHPPGGTSQIDHDTATETHLNVAENHQENLTAALLNIVSQLTGYPVEMLGLDMDIEAELGIDSIKRVEILSALEEKIPGLPAVSPDLMGSLKTLGQIAEYLSTPIPVDTTTEPAGPVPPQILSAAEKQQPNPLSVPDPAGEDSDLALIPRKVVTVAEAPPVSKTIVPISAARKVFVTEDHTGLSEEITEELAKMNIKTIKISLDILKYKRLLPQAAGLIIVQNPGSNQMDQDLKDAFALSKFLAPDLIAAGADSGAIFATVTRLDGAFGLRKRQLHNPVQGGLAGLAKTASIEWENVCCHAIDIEPEWSDRRQVASAIVREVMSMGPVEIGIDSHNRCTLTLEPEAHPVGSINLNQNDVVVVSGGARGVTATAALELARQIGSKMVLLGRSPEPFEEPEWLTAMESEPEIKKAILENQYRGKKTTPAVIEKAYKNYMANREIASNLKEMRSTGAAVYYASVDVRNFDEIQTLIDDIREKHGPISGIIHGAGVLQDRLIIDKTTDQFERVYDTKVRGLNNLLRATRRDPLKYLVLFSSVAARLGNKGQVDYAMANEVLNKIAQNESARRADCRVISINWGPWDGGMVTATLKREFERNGLHLIPVGSGARFMLHEMMAAAKSPVEVVIGAEISGANPNSRGSKNRPKLVKPTPPAKNQEFALSFEREIDIQQYPILQSHMIDGKPVVPLALMTEWFAHGALHENPGLVLQGLDDIRVMKGIRVEHDKKLIRLLSGKLQKNGNFFEVAVELRDGIMSGQDILHAKAKAILSDNLAPAPAYQFSKTMVAKAYTRKIKDVYDKILFHGGQLHGIRKIVSCSSRGMVAHISAAPAPGKWMTTPLRNQWIADPLVLDCAFQMATVWCFEEKGVVSLPSYVASYRQYCDQFPPDGVTVVLEIVEAANRKMRGDFTFLNADGGIVARLNGYEAVMDASLFKAFKPQYRASA